MSEALNHPTQDTASLLTTLLIEYYTAEAARQAELVRILLRGPAGLQLV